MRPTSAKGAAQCAYLARAYGQSRLVSAELKLALRVVAQRLLVQPDLAHIHEWRAKGQRRLLRLIARVVEPHNQPLARLGAFDRADRNGVWRGLDEAPTR